jgi:syntaxin 16
MSAGAFEDDGDAVIEMDVLPPRWLDIQDEVTEHLSEIAKQTRKLEQLHQKHVLPGFDDEEVKKREEQEIEQLTQDITRGFQKCQKAIQQIEMMVRDAKQQGTISNGEEIMARNLKISLASRVGEVSAMFRKKQAAYLKSTALSLVLLYFIILNFTPLNRINCRKLTQPRTALFRRLLHAFPHLHSRFISIPIQ